MPTLFGKMVARRELQQLAGDLQQVAGIRLMTLAEGREAGVRIADVRTGSGLRFQVTLDRGMDLSMAEYKGMPIAWRSPEGDVHPSYFEPEGRGWLRSFPGGLMTGCGMTSAGADSEDGGEHPGLHGRLSHLPASTVTTQTRWAGTECVFTVRGRMRESVPFGTNLVLDRTIESFLGRSVIVFKDRVTNEGPVAAPFMILYHFNLGWPFVEEGSRLFLHETAVAPRDADAAAGSGGERECSGPIGGFREQVYYHDCVPDADGHVTILCANSRINCGFFLRYRQRELPRFVEWKMMGEGMYVLGLEPANCLVEGRARERQAGTLQFLAPGEERELLLQCGVVEGDELAEFIRKHRLT